MTDETEDPKSEGTEQTGQQEEPSKYTDPTVRKLDEAVKAGEKARKKSVAPMQDAMQGIGRGYQDAMKQNADALQGIGRGYQEAMKKATGSGGIGLGFQGIAAGIQQPQGLQNIGKQYEEALRKARLGMGMSLRDVSGITGVSPATLSQLESGARENIRASTAAKLSEFIANPESFASGARVEGVESVESAAGVEGFALRQVDNLLRDAGLSERARRHVRETVTIWFELEKGGDEA